MMGETGHPPKTVTINKMTKFLELISAVLRGDSEVASVNTMAKMSLKNVINILYLLCYLEQFVFVLASDATKR